MNNSKGRRIQILEVGVDGGSASIFGEESDGVWRYWNEETSMGDDESGDELWSSRTSKPSADLLAALPAFWYLMHPVEINQDFILIIRQAYERCLAEDPCGQSYSEDRWDELFSVV